MSHILKNLKEYSWNQKHIHSMYPIKEDVKIVLVEKTMSCWGKILWV
jgi:hypothetical protein